MKTSKISVLIVSQQILFRYGVQLALSPMKDMKIASAADFSNGSAFAIDESPPDVVVVDIDGPSDSGLALARQLKQRLPSIGVVMLTSNPSDAQLFKALKAQAAGYLNKGITAAHLADSIRRIARGEHIINECLITHPNVADQVLQQFQQLSSRSETEDVISPLTAREIEILKNMGQGYLNKQIAIILGISEQTIKNHVTSILRKLNANARTEAVVLGIKQGLIPIA
jgi:DNA-binding NarL/FixJ family response regulator